MHRYSPRLTHAPHAHKRARACAHTPGRRPRPVRVPSRVVIHIKTNLFGKSAGDKTDANVLRAGSDELDKQVTKGDFKSKWTDIVLSIQPPFE